MSKILHTIREITYTFIAQLSILSLILLCMIVIKMEVDNVNYLHIDEIYYGFIFLMNGLFVGYIIEGIIYCIKKIIHYSKK